MSALRQGPAGDDIGVVEGPEIDRATRQLARELEGDSALLVTTMVARMDEEVEELDVHAHPELRASVRASCEGNLRAFLSALKAADERAEAPPEAIEGARVPARAGVSLESVVHTYRVGHAVVWERLVERAQELPPGRHLRHAVLVECSRRMFAYIDLVSRAVEDEFMQERQQWMRADARSRVQLVREVIAGRVVDSDELGYDLDTHHLALVVFGADPGGYLGVLEKSMPSGRALAIAVGEETAWGWLGSPLSFPDDQLAAVMGAPVPRGTFVAFGEPAPGPAGFRESHELALDAHRVATRRKDPRTRYDDVALESALLANEQAARRFVEGELSALAEDSRSGKLLGTLEAYLSTGLNASSAAALLGINERTVAYRIKAIEDRIGRPVTGRMAELSAALRLRDLAQG